MNFPIHQTNIDTPRVLKNSHGRYLMNSDLWEFRDVEVHGNTEARVLEHAAREAHAAMLVARDCETVWIGEAAQEYLFPDGRPGGVSDCDVVGKKKTTEKYVLGEGKGAADIIHAIRDQFPSAARHLCQRHLAKILHCYIVTPVPRLIRYDRTRSQWVRFQNNTPLPDHFQEAAEELSHPMRRDLFYVNESSLHNNHGMPLWALHPHKRYYVLWTHDPEPDLSGEGWGELRRHRVDGTAEIRMVFATAS